MKDIILKELMRSNSFVSGQSLCDKLSVSRTAVWKCINQLKEEGYEIESVTNKGYRIVSSPDLINEAIIKAKLQTKEFGKKVYYYDETDSTNEVIKRVANDGAPHGSVAIAEIQTAGKGRRGRKWSSPKGSGVWMSVLLRPQLEPQKASMLTLVAALAAKKAVDAVVDDLDLGDSHKIETLIKWPNDIVVNGKKICGMLTELNAEMDMIHYVVVGVGFNTNTEEFPEEIKDVATSLYIETGKKIVRSELAAGFLKAFEEYYDLFLKYGDLSGLVEDYNNSLVNLNNKVKILEPNNEYTGVARGINKEGELLVTDESGIMKVIRSGEVSVRGVYGYV